MVADVVASFSVMPPTRRTIAACVRACAWRHPATAVKRRSSTATAAVTLLGIIGGLASASPAVSASISWDDCGIAAAEASGAAIDCGWLDTGDRLAGEAVRLRVVRLRARPDRIDSTPVVYVPGGPGSDAGLGPEALAGWQRWQQRAGWRHDVVLFDPRATGRSRPRPSCDAIRSRRVAAAGQAPSSGDEFDQEAGAAEDCYRALGRETTGALGPAAQRRDLEALVAALDVDAVNLWAVSYGTRIARLYAQANPARVRAMVLDSVYPFARNDLLAMPTQIGGALVRLDAACASAPACALGVGAAPSDTVHALLERYASRAPTLGLAGPGVPAETSFAVTPYRLLLMVLTASYDADNASDTRARLQRARAGEADALRPLAARLWRQALDSDRNEAVFWSTRCALGGAVPSVSAWREALSRHPVIAPYLAPARGAPVCDVWQVPRMTPPADDIPLAAPALVVSGGEDAVTPPSWAQAFVERQPRAALLPVAGAGHGASFADACAIAAIGDFWGAPAEAQRASCASSD